MEIETRESLRRAGLEPSDFDIKASRPLFRAHERRGNTPQTTYRIVDADLYRIAENTRQHESGHPPRCTLGHIDPRPEAPETSQPLLVGFWLRFRVEYVERLQCLAIVADRCSFKWATGSLWRYPYVSVEYRTDLGRITGAACLLRDPALDLGVEIYSRSRGFLVTYSEAAMTMPVGNDPQIADDETIAEPDKPTAYRLYNCVKKYGFRAAMKRYTTLAPPGVDDEQPIPPVTTPATANASPANMPMSPPQLPAAGVGVPVKHDPINPPVPNSMATPSATNTSLPGQGNANDLLPVVQEPKGTQNAAPVTVEMYAAVQSQLHALMQANQQLADERNHQQCVALLNGVRIELYQFDEARELAYLKSLTPEQRLGHIEYIRANYRRLPGSTNGFVPYSASPVEMGGKPSAAQPRTRNEGMRAQEIATKRQISFQEALALVQSGQA